MLLNDFDYALPEELIAQEPLDKRDHSRLLVIDRKTGSFEHRFFKDIIEYLNTDDLVVFNDTKVSAVRLYGKKDTGGKVEALLMNQVSPGVWVSLVSPGKRVRVGEKIYFESGLIADVIARTEDGERYLDFSANSEYDSIIRSLGEVPLPPYIHKRLDNPERYQTIYANAEGSVAAPTAGLHFTPHLMKSINDIGIRTVFVTLNVGIATFRPVRAEVIEDHKMHTESFEISQECADAVNNVSGRIICVGTTTARALESASIGKRKIEQTCKETSLFITPGYEYKIVDCLVTNFHIPKSSLLMLVSALADRELIMKAYEEAINLRYRFFSFGDAMFVK